MRPVFLLAVLEILAGCVATVPAGKTAVDKTRLSQIYAQKGAAYLAEGRPRVALADLKKALELDPNNATAHAALALLYERLDLAEQAGTHYRRAFELRPDDPGIVNNYGRFLCQWGRLGLGLKLLAKVAGDKLYERRWIAMVNAGECAHRAGELNQAEVWLRQALDLNPNAPEALAAMSRLMAERGKWLSARAFLERYQAVAPMTKGLLELGYRIETVLGDMAAARDYLKRLELLSQTQPRRSTDE